MTAMTSRARNAILSMFFVAIHLATVVQAKAHDIPRPEDPFKDPKNDPYNPLRYIASNTLTGIAFALIIVVALAQTYLMFKQGAKWMSAMTIGAFFFAAGFGCRFGLHDNPESKGIYIAEYLFIVLSPCAFIAADYVLLGRMARYLEANTHLLIPPHRITVVFIVSDIVTFLIQAAGGSSTVSANDQKRIEVGQHIFLAGLALQLLSFLIFTVIYIRFLLRVRKYEPAAWSKDAGKKWYADWRSLAGALFASCIGILVRSVYRTVELSQGFHGHLGTTEWFFYVLDTLPLFIAISVYLPFWPGRFIPPMPAAVSEAQVAEVERGSAAGSVDTRTEREKPTDQKNEDLHAAS